MSGIAFSTTRAVLRQRYLPQCQPLLRFHRLLSTTPSIHFPTSTDPTRAPDSEDVTSVPPILRASGSAISASSTSRSNSSSNSGSGSEGSGASDASSRSTVPRSMVTQVTRARKNGSIADWVTIEEGAAQGPIPSDNAPRLAISSVFFDQAVTSPIPSSLRFRPNAGSRPGKNTQWNLRINSRDINAYNLSPNVESQVEPAHKPRNHFSWSRQASGIKTTSPPAMPTSEIGLFAPPTIVWDKWTESQENLGENPDVQRLEVLPEWISWCVVQVGIKLKAMGAKRAEQVDIVGLLNETFATEARENHNSRAGRPRVGSSPSVVFRVQWNETPQLVLQTWVPSPGRQGSVNRRRTTGNIRFNRWRKEDAYEAVDKLNDFYAEKNDVDQALGDWAKWVDEVYARN